MKKSIAILICCMAINYSFAQGKMTILLDKIGQCYDQFNNQLDLNNLEDRLTIIYIPGSNDPFSKIYNKHKGKKIADNVQFIGGFKAMMKGWDSKKKKGHLQDAFQFRYGKEHFTILLDLESEIAELFSIKGYTILQISKKENKVINIKDYGFDRIEFFKDLKQYFIK